MEKTSSESSGLIALVAEDHKYNMMLLTSLLEKKSITVIQASNGKVAVEQFLTNNIDIIFMDIHMPVMDGIEAIKKIRSLEKGLNHVPIVVLTADVFIEENEGLDTTLIDDILLKPIAIQHLWSAFEKLAIKTPECEESYEVKLRLQEKTPKTAIFKHSHKLPDGLKEKFIKEVDLLYGLVAEQYHRGNSDKLQELLHKLAGMSGYFEEPEMTCICNEFLSAIKNQDLVAIELTFQKLTQYIDN